MKTVNGSPAWISIWNRETKETQPVLNAILSVPEPTHLSEIESFNSDVVSLRYVPDRHLVIQETHSTQSCDHSISGSPLEKHPSNELSRQLAPGHLNEKVDVVNPLALQHLMNGTLNELANHASSVYQVDQIPPGNLESQVTILKDMILNIQGLRDAHAAILSQEQLFVNIITEKLDLLNVQKVPPTSPVDEGKWITAPKGKKKTRNPIQKFKNWWMS